ncbi:CHAT domain-containing protein [Armillaria novae-zelandiae]|uniref:CHAT domain-containing protein n=1 Tax=Armillaria novae-zelandiae TaxID=153914 RepID=A0AA39KFY2_9AGAR|nr:CHAT domain-containing protein [Armillaria novae-zelandiae]
MTTNGSHIAPCTMSHLNHANIVPAIEQIIRIAYSGVRLSVRIELRADSHPNLLPYNAIFAKCTTNDTLIQESTMTKEAESTWWESTQSITISTEIPSFKLSILSRYPGHDDHFLAQTEFQTLSWISKLVAKDHCSPQVFTQLDDSVLNIGIQGAVAPSELSSNPSSADESSLFDLSTTNGQSEPDHSSNNLIASPALLNQYGSQLAQRFERFGHEDDLQNAISALDRAASFASDYDPDKPYVLTNLCAALLSRFELLKDSRDLDEAVKLGSDAATLADGDGDNQSGIFYNLSNCYAARSEFHGNLDDLNSAISAAKLAVSASTEGSPQKPNSLYTLAVRLHQRFERLRDLDDLESALETGRRAFSLAAEGSTVKFMALDIVASSLLRRSQCLKTSDDLEESITEQKKALDLMPEGFPQRSIYLQNLCVSLQARFDEFGEPADLDEAIVKGTDAVNAAPSSSPGKLKDLTTLSGCYYHRFELNGDLNDLTETISLLKSALSYTPDGHIQKPAILLGLCAHLHHRFHKTKDANDLDEAVSAGRRAVACNPDSYKVKALSLSYLGSALQGCFQVYGRVDDLEESITCGRKSLSYIPDGDGLKSITQLRLSTAVAVRSDYLKNPLDAKEATSLCKSAALAPTGELSTRMDAAWQWAKLCRTVDFPSALDAYKVALDLVPRVAWTGKSIAARYRQLADFGPAVNEAVEWAIHWDEPDTALEWLEMGRAIVWGQLHNLRSPVDSLSDAHPDLARRLSQVGDALEKATSRNVDTEHFKEFTMEERAKEHRRLATEWDSLVETVRARPGFEDFLGPKRLATLKSAAKLGPVVLLNTFETRCDALVLIPGLDNVMHIPLEDFSYNRAKILQERLNKSLSALGVRTRQSEPVPCGTSGKNVFMDVLKELWTCVVKPVLDGLAFSPCDTTNPPRLWWCPTGPMAFLPIHAAGDYRTNEPGTKISDYVVSSYTPTVTILLDKLKKTRTFKGLLAISQPNTPDLSPLPGTEGELRKIEERANGVLVKCLRGEEATPDKVLDGMSICNWVHMACHATQRKANPLESTFRLHPTDHPHAPANDGHLPLSRVITKSFPDADFAYLSACQTATGDESLSEEAVHLCSGNAYGWISKCCCDIVVDQGCRCA